MRPVWADSASAPEAAVEAGRRPLVIGYGNMLRRDDGVGVRVAELLRTEPRFEGVDVLAVHQLTPELMLDIAAASLVVFVDADADASVEPGTVRVHALAADAPPAPAGPGASSHHVGATELLMLARQLGGASPQASGGSPAPGGASASLAGASTPLSGGSPPAWAVAIGVADLEMGEGLSPAVEAALPAVVETIAGLVASRQAP